MDGVIFDIKRYAVHDGPGIRTTVFLKGCWLNCRWCHNPESKNAEPELIEVDTKFGCEEIQFGKKVTVEEVINEVVKDSVFYEQSKGGVTFSGGEPLYQIEFLKALLIESKKHNIHTAVDTSGYAQADRFESIYDYTDLFLYNLKLFDEKLHIEYTGQSNKQIIKNLKYLDKLGEKVTLRIPLIPGITDTKDNLLLIINFVHKLRNIKKIDLLPYNKIGEGKYSLLKISDNITKLRSQSVDYLLEIKELFKSLDIDVRVNK